MIIGIINRNTHHKNTYKISNRKVTGFNFLLNI